MTLAAALAAGCSATLLAGFVLGQPVTFRTLAPPGARRDRQQLWLAQAGVALTPMQFVVGSVAVAAVGFLATYAVHRHRARRRSFRPPRPPCSHARTSAGAGRRVCARAAGGMARRAARLVASIAAGRSLTHALDDARRHGTAPRSATRSHASRSVARMLGTVPALELVKSELADPTSDRVIEVLILAHGARWPIVQGDPRRPRRRHDQGPQGARRDRDRGPRDEDQRPRGAGDALVGARGV